MARKIGTIPETIAIITPNHTVTRNFFQASVRRWYRYSEKAYEETYEASPAFIARGASEKSIQTGIRWANNGLPSRAEHDIEIIPNEPFSGAQLVEIEERGNGGRAWKAIVHICQKPILVDIREDQLGEIIMRHGISPEGHISQTAQFIFGMNHTQMRLLVVGSNLHEKIASGATH